MIGVYLSGTGNTKHCVEKLVKLLDAVYVAIILGGLQLKMPDSVFAAVSCLKRALEKINRLWQLLINAANKLQSRFEKENIPKYQAPITSQLMQHCTSCKS